MATLLAPIEQPHLLERLKLRLQRPVTPMHWGSTKPRDAGRAGLAVAAVRPHEFPQVIHLKCSDQYRWQGEVNVGIRSSQARPPMQVVTIGLTLPSSLLQEEHHQRQLGYHRPWQHPLHLSPLRSGRLIFLAIHDQQLEQLLASR